jgi:hypothetical protein
LVLVEVLVVVLVLVEVLQRHWVAQLLVHRLHLLLVVVAHITHLQRVVTETSQIFLAQFHQRLLV